MLARIRDFFAARGILEVETPILSAAATTDIHLDSFRVDYRGPGAPASSRRYLHTSPEFAMKRLLAAGSGAIYQIARVFRNGERGRLHNPEFTLLEWYRPGFDHHRLMDEVEEFVAAAMGKAAPSGPSERLTYRDAFLRYAGIDPHSADRETLADTAARHGLDASVLGTDERDPWLDLLLTHVIEPHLGRGCLTFLYDYPASQAALARIRPEQPPVAERFELYVEGIELANGFHELTDAQTQRSRFATDLDRRRALGLPLVSMDDRLLAALSAGLSPCAGVALGIDRMLMLRADKRSLAEVMAFVWENA